MKRSMTRHVFTGTAVGVLSLAGMSAYASCANPDLPGQQSAVQQHLTPSFNRRGDDGRHAGRILDRIVGTWHVVYTGALAGQAFIQWHSDGTEWENISYPILGGTICMGDWRATDNNHVSRSHVAWLFTNGIPSGYFTETETDEVASDGSWYHGTNYAKFYDLDGNMFAEAGGTAQATRISPP
jgi:hypothetical protein